MIGKWYSAEEFIAKERPPLTYERLKADLEARGESLERILGWYPASHPFYKRARRELRKLAKKG